MSYETQKHKIHNLFNSKESIKNKLDTTAINSGTKKKEKILKRFINLETAWVSISSGGGGIEE
jgi:hypothetical protein